MLRCVTGRAALPVQEGALTITIEAYKTSEGAVHGGRAPSRASTCFDTLWLPAYHSVDDVERGMATLLEHGKGFSDA